MTYSSPQFMLKMQGENILSQYRATETDTHTHRASCSNDARWVADPFVAAAANAVGEQHGHGADAHGHREDNPTRCRTPVCGAIGEAKDGLVLRRADEARARALTRTRRAERLPILLIRIILNHEWQRCGEHCANSNREDNRERSETKRGVTSYRADHMNDVEERANAKKTGDDDRQTKRGLPNVKLTHAMTWATGERLACDGAVQGPIRDVAGANQAGRSARIRDRFPRLEHVDITAARELKGRLLAVPRKEDGRDEAADDSQEKDKRNNLANTVTGTH